jgi:DNA ligase (NAD+)
MDKILEIKELVRQLNHYRDLYYNDSISMISDKQYDDMYDKLKRIEEETGVIMSNSPTTTVGYVVKSSLEKTTHSHPMLSLDKTKSVDDLVKFSSGNDCVISLKMDGLTVLNTYENGILQKSETRGNGEVGEIITHNVRVFDNFPINIPFDRKFEIEGEAIITKDDFERINTNGEYKTCRNLASGSVRQLDNRIAKDRHVHFVAWKVPFGFKTYVDEFRIAKDYGFEVVPYVTYNSNTDDINKKIEQLKAVAEEKSYPIDGLVISYNDVKYGKLLGMTGHHPKHSLAFKFYDEEAVTILQDIKWGMGKTGQLTPIGIFNEVQLDNTTVNKASLHNVSILKKLQLGIGDEITVYKANQIIPQIRENLTKSNIFNIPDKCPICGQPTRIVKENDSEVLMCENPDCNGKLLGKLVHAASRNALDIENLSESTIEKFINLGWLNSIQDMYHLSDHENEMKTLDGFGKKSVEKLLNSIEESRNTNLQRFLYSLSIPLLGKSASEDIANVCNQSFDAFVGALMSSGKDAFTHINGIGNALGSSIIGYWNKNGSKIIELSNEFIFEKPKIVLDEIPKTLQGKTFVVTGSVNHYKNRDELKADIVAHGGTVVGSVSSKTSYLINNDINSTSSKNQKAKSLNIPIITEEEFLKKFFEK